jgi:hypothetical protein
MHRYSGECLQLAPDIHSLAVPIDNWNTGTPVNIDMMFLTQIDFCNLFFFFKNLAVVKSPETHTSFRLASHFVRAPNSWRM